MNESVSKSCFIITPVGGNNTPIRRATDGLIKAVIEPVLKEMDFTDIHIPHKLPDPGSITSQIINFIINDDLVIANLTGLNANVMYELSLRHAVRKPIVMLCDEATTLPFDITDQRTIFYKNDMAGVVEIKEELLDKIRAAMRDANIDNPIYRVVKNNLVERLISQEPNTTLPAEAVLKRMEMMEDNLNDMSRNLNRVITRMDMERNRKTHATFNEYSNKFDFGSPFKVVDKRKIKTSPIVDDNEVV